jgi:hypothetical protein
MRSPHGKIPRCFIVCVSPKYKPVSTPPSLPLSDAPPPIGAGPAGGAPADVPHPKAIKSYVRRAGRTTTGQAKALTEWGQRFLCPTRLRRWM